MRQIRLAKVKAILNLKYFQGYSQRILPARRPTFLRAPLSPDRSEDLREPPVQMVINLGVRDCSQLMQVAPRAG